MKLHHRSTCAQIDVPAKLAEQLRAEGWVSLVELLHRNEHRHTTSVTRKPRPTHQES